MHRANNTDCKVCAGDKSDNEKRVGGVGVANMRKSEHEKETHTHKVRNLTVLLTAKQLNTPQTHNEKHEN